MRRYASFVQAEVEIPFRAYPDPRHAHLPTVTTLSIHPSVYMREFDSLSEN